MLEKLFAALMPQQGAFTPEQMEEFRRQNEMLPAAPSGSFFRVPAGSSDRQAGQLLPLGAGGQPTAIMDHSKFRMPSGAMMDGLVAPSGFRETPNVVAGAKDISSLLQPNYPEPTDNLRRAPLAAPMSAPKESFSPQGPAPKSPDFLSAARSDATQQARMDLLQQNPDWAMRFDNERSSPPAPPAAGSPEDMVRRALAFRDQIQSETAPSSAPYRPGLGYSGHIDRGNEAMQMLLGLSGRESAQRDRMSLQSLENQGRLNVADLQSRASQFGDLDKSELHIRDAVGKGLIDKQTGQAMIDTINARRGSIAGPGAGVSPPGLGGGGGGSGTMSPPISAGADVSSLRSLFGQVGPTGQFAANPAAATGQTFSQLIDKIDPSMSPQVVNAIRSGQFGDPAAIKSAAYNALAQNYMMSQGPMAGGQTATADFFNGGRGGNIPGRYTIPYGSENKPLLDLIESPPSNAVDSMRKKAEFAQSGVPYDTLRLPDGTQIPFDQTGVQGISNMSSTLGYNQGSRVAAQQRLSKLAQLVEMLQSTQPPR